MKADFELIKNITQGATGIFETGKGWCFDRMTPQERAHYDSIPQLKRNARADAGIKLEFRTDASSLKISGSWVISSSRTWGYIDIMVNGVIVAHEGSEDLNADPDFNITLPLDEGDKRIAVYFPNLAHLHLQQLELSGATFVDPVKHRRTLLAFGDSITQGYDARFPSMSYAHLISERLDAELFNVAVGGDRFNPDLLKTPRTPKPSLITIGYGTNDWVMSTKEELEQNSKAFFKRLSSLYFGIPQIVILPLWRSNIGTTTAVGTFWEMREIICRNCQTYPDVRIVDGLPLVPNVSECFADKTLHPNDLGFTFYARNLLDSPAFDLI